MPETDLDLCVIRQRRLVAEYRALSDYCIAADVAAAADDSAAYLGRGRNPRVGPDNGVLDQCLFLDHYAGAEHGIYDPCAGLYRAARADHGPLVDLSVCCDLGLALLEVLKTRYLTVEII